ncbi:MAG: DUF5057 domain-containing protein, partial [Lachnospiraceae bacterium]|nr:DUF5057 domain-containing protein [Lachnospiraceae bacterium]
MSKKKVLVIISIVAVILIATSAVTYSIATIGNSDKLDSSNKIETQVANRGASNTDYISNIDLIIDASNATPAESYNVVEILPASVSTSTIASYIKDGMFKKYVIDANSAKSPKGVMANDKVTVNTLSVGPATSLDDKITCNIEGVENVRDLFEAADLIYVSSPGYHAYDGANNMSEVVMNYLKTYATANEESLIMDYVTPADTGTAATSYKFSQLANAIQNNHLRMRTFLWGKYDKTNKKYTRSASALSFFNRKDSYYWVYNTNEVSANGKVLVVTNNENEGIYAAMKAEDEKKLLNGVMYFGNNNPSKLQYDVVAPASLSMDKLNEKYDFIILENNIMDAQISQEIYNKLKSLSEASNYILYDYDLSKTASDTTISTNANCYLQLMDLLLNSKGVSRYKNVLPVSYGFFNSLYSAGEAGITSAKSVADVINDGNYRDNNTNGKNGKKFRVLELQPCYPIDLDLAESQSGMKGLVTNLGLKGNYYKIPSEVMSGVTSDEIDEGTEYYEFELSKAKIVYASQQYAEKYGTTALTMNQIQLDQMSTEEFISKKDVVLETYDLVYIGGNVSALKPYSMSSLILNGTLDTTSKLTKLFASFDMYTHTGQLQYYRVAATHNTNVKGDMSQPYGALSADKNGTMVDLNGNDLTKRKLDELLAYIKAGMPIVFESKVTEAFEESYAVKDNRLEQLSLKNIDPDSFMYDLLENAYTNKDAAGTSINWGLKATDVVENGKTTYEATQKVDNSSGTYGNTLSDTVTVFKDDIGEQLTSLYKTAQASRPSLVLTSCPKDYVEGSKSSYNSGILSVVGYAKPAATDTTVKPIKMELYIDQNGNNDFSDSGELVASTTYNYSTKADGTAATTTLTYADMDEDYYGLISWKVVAHYDGEDACTTVNGYAYYPRKENVEKKKVRILQLMPVYGDRELITEDNVKPGETVGTYRLTDSHSGNTNYGENDG